MTTPSDLIDDDDVTIERTPEELHYRLLVEAFIATVGALGANDVTESMMGALKSSLASDYYALTADPEHAKHPDMHYVYDAVVTSWGIDRTPPSVKAERKKAAAKYEADYLNATEVELITAQNALRLPRLSPVQRQRLEDDVTFYGAELVCHERFFKSAALRRKASALIEEHKIDRSAPLRYHRE